MSVTVCSDLHHGPKDHPANDESPAWAMLWAAVPGVCYDFWRSDPSQGLKLCLGDMDELWQFTRQEIGKLVGTDVAGNHDACNCDRTEIRIRDTLFLHGHQFDPWLLRYVGRPTCWLVAKVERWWPDADVRLGAWFQERFGGGRHGEWINYAEKAAEYAVKRGARQIVFGHLHQLRECDRLVDGSWVHVVCTGCCCDGRMDFVEVEV